MRGLCKPQVQEFEPSLEPLLRGAVGKDSNGVVKSENAVGAEVAQADLEKTIIGKWITADVNGEPVLTNDKVALVERHRTHNIEISSVEDNMYRQLNKRLGASPQRFIYYVRGG